MLGVSGHAKMFGIEINPRRLVSSSLSFLALAAIIALFFAYRSHAQHLIAHNVPVSTAHLAYYAFCSFYRMLAAYVIALLFSIIYGMAAARSRPYERILIPAIDIAQSVPVVGFFPAAVYFFVALAHGSRLGVEMAAVFLIFTSQAWNMALGVYEAVKTIPDDSRDALESFGARGWLKFKRLLMPASVPKLVYNSILSWVAGWYFLIACEIITVGPASYRLPGLGSFLWEAAENGRKLRSRRGTSHLARDHRGDGHDRVAAAVHVGGEVSLRIRGVVGRCAAAGDVRRARGRSARQSRVRCARSCCLP